MNYPCLKKFVFFSFLAHALFFTFFNLSLVKTPRSSEFGQVFFLSSYLYPEDFRLKSLVFERKGIKKIVEPRKISYAEKIFKDNKLYSKPLLHLDSPVAKLFLPPLLDEPEFPVVNREAVLFRPYLPRHFLLFFKDRQKVHIEFSFKIETTGGFETIAVKRKISSGNLEADLLSQRYISRYIFVQRMNFPKDTWQTVKVELSTQKN